MWTTTQYPQAFGIAFFDNPAHFAFERICDFGVLTTEQEHALRCTHKDSIVSAKLTRAKCRTCRSRAEDGLVLINCKGKRPLYVIFENDDVFESMCNEGLKLSEFGVIEEVKIRFIFFNGKKETVSLTLNNNKAGIPRSEYGEIIESWLDERGFFKCQAL